MAILPESGPSRSSRLEHVLFNLSHQGRLEACGTYRRHLGGFVGMRQTNMKMLRKTVGIWMSLRPSRLCARKTTTLQYPGYSLIYLFTLIVLHSMDIQMYDWRIKKYNKTITKSIYISFSYIKCSLSRDTGSNGRTR